MVLRFIKRRELDDQRKNDSTYSAITLRSAFSTLLLFLVLLTVGNILVEIVCQTEFERIHGRIIVRFASCIALILICIKYFKLKLSSKENSFSKIITRSFIIGGLLGLSLFSFMLFVDVIEYLIFKQYAASSAHELWLSKKDFSSKSHWGETELFFGLFVACIIAPFAEEILFRVLFFNALKLHFKTPFAILIAATIFVIVHFNNPFIIGTMTFSIALSILYLRSGSLWPCVLAHGSFNFCSFIYENYLENLLFPLAEKMHLENTWELISVLSCFLVIIFFTTFLINFRWIQSPAVGVRTY